MKDPCLSEYVNAVAAMEQGELDTEIVGDNPLAVALRGLRNAFRGKLEALESLAVITEKVNSGFTLTEVLDHVYDSFHGIIPYDRIGFALLEQDGLVARAVWERSESKDKKLDTGYSANIEGSSLKTVLDTGRPRIIGDLPAYLHDHPHSESTRRIVADGVRSSLTCPLSAQGKHVGFVFFSSTTPGAYDNAHVDLFMRIAGNIALSVEKGRLYQRLLDLNEIKNRFLGIAAHDLRSPLASARGFLALFLNGYLGALSEKQIKYVEKIDGICANMSYLINDLLDVSAIEAGKLDLNLEPTRPRDFLAARFEAFSILANSKSITLKLDVEPDLPSLLMDSGRIDQVINNLLTNAIKFSFPNSEITIGARNKSDGIEFFVTDRGQGIPAEDIPRLFSEFAKTSVRPTAGEKSTGLGLAIVKRIVEAHNGRVGVASTPGAGSSFYFTLPFHSV